jgi:hypothetical protein
MIFEWDVTSITSVHTTLTQGNWGGYYYGTLFGEAGLWLKMPTAAPPIGYVTLDAASVGGNQGLYGIRGTTWSATVGNEVRGALQIEGYQQGGRWFRIDRSTAVPAKMKSGAYVRKLRLCYVSVNEGVSITA